MLKNKKFREYFVNLYVLGARFLDTMSLHVCVSGVTSYQRAILKSKNKEIDPEDESWIQISSLNNLADVNIIVLIHIIEMIHNCMLISLNFLIGS